jgi:hypothetical protein
MIKIHPHLAGACLSLGLMAAPATAQEWSSGRPDGHAPIGVMGDHVHSAGEVMLSYRFMRMEMDGNRVGTDAVTPDAVLDDYMVTPLTMPMNMHMVGVMFAPVDRVTFMAMIPYISVEMDHRTRMGGEFTTASSGLGDVGLSALVSVFNADRKTLHLNLGFRAPTGTIEAMDVTPASAPAETQLPYPMQLGSGTWDIQAGATVLGQGDRASWGAQLKGTFRLGENDRGYRLGHRGLGTAWAAWRFNDWVSVSGRGELTAWGDVDGADAALNPMMVPTADPALRGGRRADFGLGLNFEVAEGALHGQRLAVELVVPAWQDLNGPQLETDWSLVVGWQYAFQLVGSPH